MTDVTKPELTRGVIEPYVLTAEGEFTTEQIRRHFEIESRPAKDNLRQILGRMVKEGVIRRGRRDGTFQRVDNTLQEMDWSSIDQKPLPILWPLDLHKYVDLYEKSIAIIAGTSNAGKTAFCLQFAYMNSGLGDKLKYYNNETGPQQYARRLMSMGVDVPPPWKVYQREDKFEDVIGPDDISVIDYLPVPPEAYMLQSQVDAIWRKLSRGMVLIALQKPKGRDDAYGGFMLRGRAQLYLALDYDDTRGYRIKIVKAKSPADPTKNPNDKEWSFYLKDGVHFQDVINPVFQEVK